MAYVNFVNHCYVDTEVEMKEIYTSNHIWTLFENFTLDNAGVCLWGVGLSWPLEGGPAASVVGSGEESQALVSSTQVCSKRERRLADPALEKYVLTVVPWTPSALSSAPFSEQHLPAGGRLLRAAYRGRESQSRVHIHVPCRALVVNAV